MRELFERAFTEQRLLDAWREVRLLDRHMSRYSHRPEPLLGGSVGARERPGQRLAVVNSPGSTRSGPGFLIGWRDAPQKAWSRAPPKRIRRKVLPDIEGIETNFLILDR
jgi:hypothetical protein